MRSDEPFVTVAIATYNRGTPLLSSIECVLEDNYPNYELLIIDQTEHHPPNISSSLNEYTRRKHVHHIQLPVSNLPFARNVGLRLAQGKIIIYIDDDVELQPNFIDAHVERYQDPSVHAVAGRVLDPHADPQHDSPPPPGRIAANGRIEGHFGQANHDGHPVEWGLGCNMSFRTSTLSDIGAFDERYTGAALNEEVDAFIRLNEAGYNAVFAPNASLIHHVVPEGGCRDTETKVDGARSATKNRCLYATKNLTGSTWIQYLLQEIRSAYSFVRIQNLDPLHFMKLVASSMRGVAAFYLQSPNRYSNGWERIDPS